eukprot:TRINITY_DN58195_c0_g1_i1.p1 TRINITY_DN58195_c0_g1~~TRINITY_DN58195_c0_g1_i1.p1  ORF type:complete len:181 (+),score=16.74 TRINITY_DN58195_c0_g1_i1:108-650(+)
MASYRLLAVLCLVIIASSCTVDAGVSPKELKKAIQAIRRSPQIKVAVSNATLEKIFRLVTLVSNKQGPVTLLIPADFGFFANIATGGQARYTLPQLDKLRKFHFVKGISTQADIKALPKNSEIATLLGTTSIKKITPPSFPVVLLKGAKILPSILLAGDLYVGQTLAVHLISSMLTPPGL